MEVIGLGMGRTGTLSLKLALEELGYGPCHHMEELLDHPEQVRYWKELHQKGNTNWEQLFANYQSAVDFPSTAYYPAIVAQYPDAKLILTERDPEDWYRSAYATILNAEPGFWAKLSMAFQLPFSRKLRQRLQIFQLAKAFWIDRVGPRFKEKKEAIAFFKRWNAEIKEQYGDRLLCYEVKEGWEPLCTFLGCPVPDKAFPRSNSQQSFKEKNKNLMK